MIAALTRRAVRQLLTLEDAGNYITKLPKTEHEAQEWLAAMEALILVAEHDGPTMMARIGIMRALNHGKPRRDIDATAQGREGLQDREMKSPVWIGLDRGAVSRRGQAGDRSIDAQKASGKSYHLVGGGHPEI
jgi:hypothetical protein